VNTGLLLLIVTVTTALIFDFLNGFHDAANSIATVVSTRVLSPKLAVIWAAFFNFVAAFFLGTAVAKTIGKGMIRLEDVTQYVVIAGLAGAIVWDLLTWWWGLPTSSSHALIGGYAGAAMARAALNRGLGTAYSVILPQGWTKTLIFIVIAPVIGLILALAFSVAGYWVLQNRSPRQVDTWFRKLQLLSAAAYSLGHGGNDAQKTMGIIAVLLYSQGHLGKEFSVPFWVVLACQAAMALGTLMGGWRIVRTMGLRITKLTPMQGFCAETGGAATLFMATWLGVPVSTTHTITGAIVGVGAARRVSAVRWNVASSIVYAWVITIPAAAAVAALTYWAVLLLR